MLIASKPLRQGDLRDNHQALYNSRAAHDTRPNHQICRMPIAPPTANHPDP